MKILHSADWHIRDNKIDEAEKCIRKIIETAEVEEVDLVIIAGDLFHSQEVKLDSLSAKLAVRAVSALADIAPVAIVTGTPSHDGRAAEVFDLVRGANPVKVAAYPEQVFLMNDYIFKGMEYKTHPANVQALLSFVPQPTKQFFQGEDQEISEGMTGIFAGFGATAAKLPVFHIVIGHFTVSGAAMSGGQVMIGRDIEISDGQIDLLKADLVCLGHIHVGQSIGEDIFYPGSIYRVNDGEVEDKGFWIHKLTDSAKNSRFIKTPCKKLVRIKKDWTAEGRVDFGTIPESMDDFNGADVRVDIRVYQDEAARVDIGAFRSKIMETAESCDIRLIRIPRESVRAERVIRGERLADKLRVMAEIRGEEFPGSLAIKADRLEDISEDELIQYEARRVGV